MLLSRPVVGVLERLAELAVDFRAVLLRAVLLRAVVLRAVDFRAVLLRAVVFRAVVLRAVVLRAPEALLLDFRAGVLFAAISCPPDPRRLVARVTISLPAAGGKGDRKLAVAGRGQRRRKAALTGA